MWTKTTIQPIVSANEAENGSICYGDCSNNIKKRLQIIIINLFSSEQNSNQSGRVKWSHVCTFTRELFACAYGLIRPVHDRVLIHPPTFASGLVSVCVAWWMSRSAILVEAKKENKKSLYTKFLSVTFYSLCFQATEEETKKSVTLCITPTWNVNYFTFFCVRLCTHFIGYTTLLMMLYSFNLKQKFKPCSSWRTCSSSRRRSRLVAQIEVTQFTVCFSFTSFPIFKNLLPIKQWVGGLRDWRSRIRWIGEIVKSLFVSS